MFTLLIGGFLLTTPMLAMFAWEDVENRQSYRKYGRWD